MNFPTNWRDRRSFLAPPHYPFASYCTDTKNEMKNTFGDELFLNNLYLGPDPLRKNLADMIITDEKVGTKNGKIKLENEKEKKTEENPHMHEDYSPLSGITNFFSGVLNVISNAMFSKRKPADFNSTLGPEMALPAMWHGAKLSDENKILQDEISDDMSSEFFASEMSECRAAAAHCKSKLDQVRVLLGSSKPVPCSLRVRRRPKKVFVEPSSVEDSFEDAFSPEDFESLANDSYIEFSSPICYHEHVFHELDGPKVKVEAAVVPKVVSESPKVATEASKEAPELNKVPKTFEMVSETPKIVSESIKIVPETAKIESKPAKMVPDDLRTTTVPLKQESKTAEVNIEPLKTMQTDPLVRGSTENVKNVPELNTNNTKLETESKKELVESCEDKITKLKLLLQERRKKPKVVVEPQPEVKPVAVRLEPVAVPLEPVAVPFTKLEPEPEPLVKLPPRPKPSSKVKDKRFKNPNRTNDKRRKSRMRKNIHDDVLFANELNSDDVSSVENSPSTNNMENYMRTSQKTVQNPENGHQSQPKPVPQKEYFDEVSGRFHSASLDSEDSFQIVFNDSPKLRRSSDCESEDSFIIFEDSPDSCYTSNDVFGDSSDSEEYNSDSDMSDSGCGTFKLSASLSKSISNLADDSLYVDQSEDEVDCANVKDFTVCDTVTMGDMVTVSDVGDTGDSKGVLLTERKKLLRKDLPAKRVHFSPHPPKVHVMRVWLFAAKQTRQRYWEQFVTDRDRFKRRIADVDMAVSWVLKPQHRSRVMFQRFMPWWNAQRRKEIADRKEREAQDKLKEEERLRVEEVERQKAELKEEGDSELPKESLVDGEIVADNEINTVGLKQEDNVEYKGRVAEERGDNDTLVIEEINCQNATEKNTKLNEKERENNTKNSKKSLDEKLRSDQIVPFNDKILDLNPEYVSGILET